MPSATLTVFKKWLEYEAEGVVNAASDQFTVALTNSAPDATTGQTLADITEVAYTNLSSRNLVTSSSAMDGSTYELVFADLTLTSTGGPTGPFQWVVIYDNTPTSPADPLLGYLDYGGALTLQDGDALTLNFSPTTGVLNKTASP